MLRTEKHDTLFFEISMKLPENTIVAAGPVILEDNKILLVREIKKDGIASPFFMLPGGGIETFDESFEATCVREAQEELGIAIKILRPLEPLFVKRPDKDGYAILIHFLCERLSDIQPSEHIVEWGWFNLNNLPDNCTPSIRMVLDAYFQEKHI